ncbi:hypothetical protein MUY14_18160 [Amycolatopsis sp. FBCC-B4732]|uniref:hypothetical protein n=1 Tax=Amycolatopsis sp. FBCC-B4732 TaxID=3079339 RepID=UPI001FF2A73E|nr:hypothetical protein [Amycolatopsis sp. FBCC-B4732]UOX92448.1 hypothetical protein MUY14_18160 [Amycolatopsis sp. FBCC-B4732]
MSELGPFQAMWRAWDAVDEELKAKPLGHFERSIEIQFEEMREHLAAGDRDAAVREAVDVVSIGLNCLRWMGLDPTEVAEAVRSRTDTRMQGKTHEILDKYQRLHGI